MNRTRILFVDDEVAVLEGLRNLLRKERHRWDMVFVNSGDAALAAMRESRFDIVVTDMRMPGMDGASLLERIQAEWPDAGRIVLSGHAETDIVARALPLADHCLSKPCTRESLRAAIESSSPAVGSERE